MYQDHCTSLRNSAPSLSTDVWIACTFCHGSQTNVGNLQPEVQVCLLTLYLSL